MIQSRKLLATSTLLAILSMNLAHAQAPGTTVVNSIGRNLNGVVIPAQAGNYSFQGFDQTQAMTTLVKAIDSRSKADLAYFKESITYLNQLFQNIVNNDVYGKSGLKILSDNSSQGGQLTPAKDFLRALNKFEQDKIEIQAAIAKVSSITTAFPSQTAVKVGTVNTAIPSYGQVKFDGVVKFYNEQLEKITAYLSNLPQGVKLQTGNPFLIPENTGNSLVLNAPAFQYNAQEIRKLKNQILTLRTWSEKSWDVALIPYTGKVKQMVQQFIRTYGSSERYRYDASTPNLMKEELTRFVDYFYARSYLRAVYGMPLGAIGITYNQKAFNTDYFFSSNSVGLIEEVIREEQDFPEVEKAYTNALKAANARTQSVFGKGVDFLERLNSAFTQLKGENRLAVANRMMFDLLVKDFQEERLLMTQGVSAMLTSYRARYKSTPEKAAYYSKLKKRYDALVNNEAIDDQDNAWSNSGNTVSKGSVNYFVQQVAFEAQVKENELGQADELEEQLQNMMRLAQKRVGKRVSRSRDL